MVRRYYVTIQRPDWDLEPLYPIEAGFDEDENMSSFLHSQQRREERGEDSASTSARLLSCVFARFLSRLFLIPDRHPTVQLAAESVTTILQSSRPDDVISAELAELLGFKDIDLVMELTHNRSQIVEQLAVRLSFAVNFLFFPVYSDTEIGGETGSSIEADK